MLLEDFYQYTVAHTAEHNVSAVIEIQKQHEIFSGHFPDFPLVPGVCQVLMVKEVLEQHLDKTLRLTEAKSIKFLTAINPNEVNSIQADISFNNEADSILVSALFHFNGKKYLKFRGSFCENI